MRKKIAVLTFLLSIALAVAFSSPSAVAFAEEECGCTVTYVSSDGKEIVSSVNAGLPLDSFIGYYDIVLAKLYTQEEVEGKKLVFYNNATNEPLTAPYIVNENITIRIELEPTEEKVVYTYAYGLNKDGKPLTEKHEYVIGTSVKKPTSIGGIPVFNGTFYTDINLNAYATFAEYAYEDVTYYPLLDKTIDFTMNGKEYSCKYGASVKETVNTGTFGVTKVYTDKEETSEYVLPVLSEIALYGKFSRTHYAVTFTNGPYNMVVHIPVDEPVLSEKDFPKEMDDVAEWRIDETKRIDFPITLTEDITLIASNGLNNPINEVDRILLYCAGAALLLMAGWGAIYEHRKTVKKRKIEEEIRVSGKQTADEKTPEQENHSRKNTKK